MPAQARATYESWRQRTNGLLGGEGSADGRPGVTLNKHGIAGNDGRGKSPDSLFPGAGDCHSSDRTLDPRISWPVFRCHQLSGQVPDIPLLPRRRLTSFPG